MNRENYYIDGMDCAEEVGALEKELAKLKGIDSTAFDVLRSRMSVTYDETQTSDQAIRKAVAQAGLRADKWSSGHEEKQTDKGRVIAMAISGGLLFIAFVSQVILYGWNHALGGESDSKTSWWIVAAYVISAIAGAWFVVPRALKSARAFRPDMNLLMTVAVIGALAIGEWFEGASVAFLFAASLALERWSVGRARRAVEALMTLTPAEARIRNAEGKEYFAPVGDVGIGATIIVLPGERFPLDGKVKSGSSWVDQSPVTGESVPVSREQGDEVFAGSINGDGALEVEIARAASEGLLAKVGRMVEEARLNKSGHEKWVEGFARVYTPIVLLLAAAFLIFPPLFLGHTWSASFYNALVMLVIACPCALVISTPVSVVAALASAASHGVLIKGGVHVESPAKLSTIALDKTGTITQGRLVVADVMPMSGHNEHELVQIAAALEQRSTHPLALAILRYAAVQQVEAEPAVNLLNLPGKGAQGEVFGRMHWIGSHRFLEERGQETPDVHEQLVRVAANGSSVVIIGNDEHVCGFLSLSDQINPDARAVVAELHSLGITCVAMLTGDNRPTAEAIAREAGIDEIYPELLPEDKSKVIAELFRTSSGGVAMVGDGVNDAPAMASATVGIAMGGNGTDVAIETSDIVLMTDNLQRIPWVIRHARRTVAIIRQNIFLALASKGVFIALAAVGMATLWMAIVADMGVSLLAVFNALRLLKKTPTMKEGEPK